MTNKKEDMKHVDSKDPFDKFNKIDEFKTEEVTVEYMHSIQPAPSMYQKTLTQRLQLPFIGLMLLCGLFFKS